MKKILISTIIATVLLSSAFLAIPVISQSPYEKIVFVHYHKDKGSNGAAVTCSDQVADYKFLTRPVVKWTSKVSYSVNPTNSKLDGNAVLSALSASSATWDSSTGFPLFNQPTSDSSAKPNLNSADSKHTVSWEDLSTLGFSNNVIAVTYVWYNRYTGQIADFDMMMNTKYTWSVSGDKSAMDVKNIATHELGHAVGLSDLYNNKDCGLTMYGYSGYGETMKQTLGKGDILGLQALYGS